MFSSVKSFLLGDRETSKRSKTEDKGTASKGNSPIEGLDKSTLPKAHGEIVALSKVARGSKARVLEMNGDSNQMKLLQAMGLEINSVLKVVKSGGHMIVIATGARIALDKAIAELITVERLAEEG